MCVHMWELEEDTGYPVISPLALFLRWDLLLNLELACQPISSRVPPISASQSTKIASTLGHT